MRRIPNFVLLRAFEAAARLESFTLAAHELHLTPSAISHQVRELEGVLGCALFVRRHRRVEPTPEGRRLVEGLTRIMDALEACCSEVALPPAGQVLVLHCAPSFAVKWLGPRLAAFMRACPDITIRLLTDAVPADLTTAREIDVAVSYGHALERPGVDVTPLGRERIVPLCAPALRDPALPAARQIAGLTLIDSQLSEVGWPHWFAQNQLRLPARARPSFDRAALAISAAADGMGVALESTRLAERELARGELEVFGGEAFQGFERETHFLSQRRNERHLDRIRSFRRWLLAELRLPEDAAPAGA